MLTRGEHLKIHLVARVAFSLTHTHYSVWPFTCHGLDNITAIQNTRLNSIHHLMVNAFRGRGFDALNHWYVHFVVHSSILGSFFPELLSPSAMCFAPHSIGFLTTVPLFPRHIIRDKTRNPLPHRRDTTNKTKRKTSICEQRNLQYHAPKWRRHVALCHVGLPSYASPGSGHHNHGIPQFV